MTPDRFLLGLGVAAFVSFLGPLSVSSHGQSPGAPGNQEARAAAPPALELRMGLEVIARRSTGLARFLAGYGRLARLPPPVMQPVRIDEALRRVTLLEKRLPVVVSGSGRAAARFLHGP